MGLWAPIRTFLGIGSSGQKSWKKKEKFPEILRMPKSGWLHNNQENIRLCLIRYLSSRISKRKTEEEKKRDLRQ